MSEPALSKRERQIMDVIFQLQEASAREVHLQMPDPPSYTAVRTMLRILEEKGWITHRQEGRKYIYTPCRSAHEEGRSALHRVLEVFFGGSLEDAVAAHLNDPKMRLSSEEVERLQQVIDEAGKSPKSGRKQSERSKDS